MRRVSKFIMVRKGFMKATIKVNVGKLPKVGSKIERRDYSQVAWHSSNAEEVKDSGDTSGFVDPVPEEEK
jgi:hypothetical protein